MKQLKFSDSMPLWYNKNRVLKYTRWLMKKYKISFRDANFMISFQLLTIFERYTSGGVSTTKLIKLMGWFNEVCKDD